MIALISVYDKAGVKEFALNLAELGFDIYSTGGTQRHLGEAGLPVHSVSALTGFPEILDGRVKTLPPMVHGGHPAHGGCPAPLPPAPGREGVPARRLLRPRRRPVPPGRCRGGSRTAPTRPAADGPPHG